VIAEIGINHNGDVDLARRLIDAAAEAGADAVKFQNYRTEDFISDRNLTWSYDGPQGKVVEPQYDMFKRYEFIGDKLAAAAEHCRKRGIDFAATPTSNAGVAECVKLGAAFLKNGSDYLTCLPLIRTMARTGLQTVLSTGMADEGDIGDAVEAFRQVGGKDLVLLHCVSLYPAPPDALNLKRIPALANAFRCPVGFSDHSEGVTAAAVAVAFGAVALERHVTLDKTMPGPDHQFSADPGELKALVQAVREAEVSLGDGAIRFGDAEKEARAQHRLSCIAARNLPEGAVIAATDIAFRRPGQGLPPKFADQLVGRRTARAVPSGHVFALEDFK